jgi:acyl carrier protein
MALHKRLEELFRQVFNDDSLILTDDMTADDISGWDSVGHINLMFSIEQAFAVQFTGNELAEFKTIGEIKRFLAVRARLSQLPGECDDASS